MVRNIASTLVPVTDPFPSTWAEGRCWLSKKVPSSGHARNGQFYGSFFIVDNHLRLSSTSLDSSVWDLSTGTRTKSLIFFKNTSARASKLTNHLCTIFSWRDARKHGPNRQCNFLVLLEIRCATFDQVRRWQKNPMTLNFLWLIFSFVRSMLVFHRENFVECRATWKIS